MDIKGQKIVMLYIFNNKTVSKLPGWHIPNTLDIQ